MPRMRVVTKCRSFLKSHRTASFPDFHHFVILILPFVIAVNGSSQNLVVNGSFSDGMAGWDSLLINNPAQATKSVSNGICQIAISNAGTEPWHVQFKQKGIALDSNQVYLFSFEAYAAAARQIDASVGMENGPYTLYTPANQVRFSLGTEKKKFQIYFRMTYPSDTNARVQFNCGLAAIDVFISNVSIEKVTTPLIMLTSPVGGETWSSNSTQKISWIGGGADTVALSYSIDAGLTWVAISTTIDDKGSYLWTVPAVSSPWCLVRVLDVKGSGIGDTSALPFEIGTYFNIVRNGAFNDTPSFGWDRLGVYGSASASGSITNGAYVITIDAAGADIWNVQFTQQGIPLVQGERYVFSFSAWASESRSLYANIGQAGGAYQSYLDDTAKGRVTLSTEAQTYGIDFIMSKPSDTAARIEFNTGLAAGKVYIDNVSLFRQRVQSIKYGSPNRNLMYGRTARCVVRRGIQTVSFIFPLQGAPLRAHLFDLRGRPVGTIDTRPEIWRWDGRTNNGTPVAAGAYVIRIFYSSGSSRAPLFLPVR
jgi:hypothetical protein